MSPADSASDFQAPTTPDYAAVLAGTHVDLAPSQVAAVIGLLDEGATVPFISRYRKEATGGADDLAVQTVRDELQKQRDLFDRKSAVLESIHGQGKLTPELRAQIEKVA